MRESTGQRLITAIREKLYEKTTYLKGVLTHDLFKRS